ncbi:MAG TPA: O-linked N-acetylglucosamine transferase, SPINDLY family protein [Trichocoleus sp.]
MSLSPAMLQQQAQEALAQNHYAEAALYYEQLMELEPDQISHAWFLGLARLLTGDETEAQFTWMMALSTADSEQVDRYTQELVQILQTAAEQQAEAEADQMVWAIRQHLREIAQTEIHNLLHLVRLAIKLNLFNSDYLETLEIAEVLQSQSFPNLDESLLLQTVAEVLEVWFGYPGVEAFAEAAIGQIGDTAAIVNTLKTKAFEVNHDNRLRHGVALSGYLAEICLRYEPNDLELLRLLSSSYELTRRYTEAVATARLALAACRTLEEQMAGLGFLCIRMLRAGSYWQEVQDLFEQQQALMPKLLAQYQPDPEQQLETTLLTFCSFYLYYLKDAPAEHRQLQNQLAALVQTDVQFQSKHIFVGCPKRSAPAIRTERKLKVGYIARYMQQHPVGWLARWLMQYHDRNRFDIYTYHLHLKGVDEFTDRWFVRPVTRSARFDEGTPVGVAKHICENDEIDILVDLDSLTYSETCSIMALKPAPVQISWLGFDASGIPAVDYFLADPHVLPNSAQSYYSEKIWRLPSTYLAVDGFEIGVPTLRRDHLGIPTDAVVYLSSQDGRKRHPEMMRLQMQIIREVPNSYLLIKGLGDEKSIQEAFEQVAEAEGVTRDRLRFLTRDRDELTHRANLGIADVVLDTFPYNGATTTLETLWMGIPIVTRTGQQWAARNSYTMLMNVGVTEGIAWTNEEYVAWGVRLGEDAALRQNIHLRLLQSRQTSPLWNTRLFAREMEDAYQQMWQIYLQG